MAEVINLGNTSEGTLSIDIPTLINTRLLIQANSGGGKSYLIRRILEQSYGKVQHIILDLEGEFSTLRENFEYLLVGKEGDIPINIKTAELLAKRILEINISTIIDLYELKHHERILFVKRFLESMINAPKELWHPCLVVIDEAHIFAPEQGKCEAMSAVIDLCTRGRKREYAAILATQRLSKLHKDTAAEANNVLIGRTGLDVDMKRASETLGFTNKIDMLGLRNLEPGEFYTFGPAISRSVTKVKVGQVKTTHTKVGTRIVKVSTSTEIKKILEKLKDLPQEVDKEIKTIEDFKKEIYLLKIQLKNKSLSPEDIEKNKKVWENEHNITIKQYQKQIDSFKKILATISNLAKQDMGEALPIKRYELPQKKQMPTIESRPTNIETKSLRDGAMRMLKAVGQFNPKPISRQQLATLTGFSSNGGTYNTYLSELKRNGWIQETYEGITITEDGLNNVGEISALPNDPEEIIELWASKFRDGAAKMLKVIASYYPEGINKESLGEETGFTTSGGTFNTYISELRRNGLIKIEGSIIRASKELFLED